MHKDYRCCLSPTRKFRLLSNDVAFLFLLIIWKTLLVHSFALLPVPLQVVVPPRSSCHRLAHQGDDNNSHEEEEEDDLIRYRGRVSYDGSSYQGFQIQLGKKSDAATIQAALEDVLQRRFTRNIRVVGSGRTDSGVSARGQAFHFDLTSKEHAQLEERKVPLDHVWNRMLPDQDIRVYHVGPAPPPREKTKTTSTRLFPWNAIHDSTRKLYSYRLCVGPVLHPLDRFQRWQIPNDGKFVDLDKLRDALAKYEGTHDFRAFAGAVEQSERRAQRKIHSVRTIYKCELVEENGDEGYYRIDIVLSGALYKMVRNMVGVAVDVSRGRIDMTTLQRLI
ncbi:pseudouridine synthase A (Partial), partial [Seminavis robusta]|eukprot:Sro1124_g243880.1 pseudouridine synthase A (333) ;mRNA; f:35680-36678